HVVDQFSLRGGGARTGEDVRSPDPLCLLARQHPREDRLGDPGQRHPELERRLAGPATCAFLFRLVLDRVDERVRPLPAWALRADATSPRKRGREAVVVLGEDVGGDLDQVGLQAAVVPLAKDRGELVGRLAERVAHLVVAFRDTLYVWVLVLG